MKSTLGLVLLGICIACSIFVVLRIVVPNREGKPIVIPIKESLFVDTSKVTIPPEYPKLKDSMFLQTYAHIMFTPIPHDVVVDGTAIKGILEGLTEVEELVRKAKELGFVRVDRDSSPEQEALFFRIIPALWYQITVDERKNISIMAYPDALNANAVTNASYSGSLMFIQNNNKVYVRGEQSVWDVTKPVSDCLGKTPQSMDEVAFRAQPYSNGMLLLYGVCGIDIYFVAPEATMPVFD